MHVHLFGGQCSFFFLLFVHEFIYGGRSNRIKLGSRVLTQLSPFLEGDRDLLAAILKGSFSSLEVRVARRVSIPGKVPSKNSFLRLVLLDADSGSEPYS